MQYSPVWLCPILFWRQILTNWPTCIFLCLILASKFIPNNQLTSYYKCTWKKQSVSGTFLDHLNSIITTVHLFFTITLVLSYIFILIYMVWGLDWGPEVSDSGFQFFRYHKNIQWFHPIEVWLYCTKIVSKGNRL